jgi:hypothetical protein
LTAITGRVRRACNLTSIIQYIGLAYDLQNVDLSRWLGIVPWRAVFFSGGPALAAQVATPESELAYQMAIDVWRIDTMVTHAEDAADAILANQMPEESANLREYDESTIRNLKMPILRYNLLVEGACDADRPNREFCGVSYMPNWLRAASSTVYGRNQMQTMIPEACARITPYWNAVYIRGRVAALAPRYCELE